MNDARRPFFESLAARLGVLVLVALSVTIGFRYWAEQGDEQLAWLTVAAELIAFAGLAVARSAWKRQPGWAAMAILLTAIAAIWCGLTMFEKIRDDGRQRALEAAQATLAYQTASRELTAASEALSAKLAESPPLGVGPQTIAAWEAAQAASVTRLENARDSAQARLDAAIPAQGTDWIAIARGAGVELIKLFGFAAFGLLTPLGAPMSQPSRSGLWGRVGASLGLAALATQPAAASPPVAPPSPPVAAPEPIFAMPATGPKAEAFSMRGRMPPEAIAAKIGVHRATVYRWFAKRDRELRAMAA